jgi:Flp pilus assembly pilin Flp
MKSWLTRLVTDERGQDLIEYALLTAFIALASALGLNLIRAAINVTYGTWNSDVNNLWQPPNPSGGGS